MKLTWKIMVVAAFGLATAGQGAELAAIWQDPEFKKQFVGTYGILAEVEPRVTPEEREVLEKIFPLMSSDQPKAAKILEGEAGKKDGTAMINFTLANIYFQQDKLADAAKQYTLAVTKFPSYRRAHKNLGLIHVRQGEYAEAIKSFTKMIELGGGDALSYGLLGYAYVAKNDYLAAEGSYRNALLLQPENTDWRLGLARCIFKQQKFEEAAALLDVLLEKYPDRAEFWLLQANAYLGMKQPLKAAENFEFVSRLGKATVDSLNTLGDIYVNENLPDLAADAYIRGMEANREQPLTRPLRAAEVLAQRGAMAQAKRVTGKINELFAARLEDADKRRLLKLDARISVAEGDGGEAAKVLEEIVKLDPLDGEALMLLGQHYGRSGETERAVFYYERAGGVEAFEAPAKTRLAQVLVGQGKYQDAVPLLRRAQELKPREEVARYLEQVERLARTRR